MFAVRYNRRIGAGEALCPLKLPDEKESTKAYVTAGTLKPIFFALLGRKIL
jgi:hypothetical protein